MTAHGAQRQPGCACEFCGTLKFVMVPVYLCGDGKVQRVTRLISWREPAPGEAESTDDTSAPH